MPLSSLRQFFQSRLPREQKPHGPDPVAIAACALLLEIAHADDEFADEERERIRRAACELTHRLVPSAAALRPSSVVANFQVTNGRWWVSPTLH